MSRLPDYLEGAVDFHVHTVPFATIERAVTEAGVNRTILSADLAQPDTPPPVEGLCLFAERLCSSGFSVDDIRMMMQANPKKLLAPSKPICQQF
jgi:hypothetical protein